MKRLAFAFAMAALGLPAAVYAANTLTPGKWQITGKVVSMEMPGMPAGAAKMMAGRPFQHSYCLTPEDAAKGAKEMLANSTRDDCTYTKFDMKGGKLDAVMHCRSPQGDMNMSMSGDYGPTAYSSTSTMVIEGPQGTMKTTSKIEGKRIGDC